MLLSLNPPHLTSHMLLCYRWSSSKACKAAHLSQDSQAATLRLMQGDSETVGQATVLGVREYNRTELHTWIVRYEPTQHIMQNAGHMGRRVQADDQDRHSLNDVCAEHDPKNADHSNNISMHSLHKLKS